jgi:hypothetical protein
MLNLDNELIILIVCILAIIYITFQANTVQVYEDPLVFKLKQDLMTIDPRVVNINFYASNKSFTEDKKRIYLCLKDRHGQYYDYNMLIYVACHELAHAFSSSVDYSHTTEEFRTNYSNLLTNARNAGLWDENKPIVEQYCNY